MGDGRGKPTAVARGFQCERSRQAGVPGTELSGGAGVGTLCKGISAAYDNYEYKEQPGEATSVQYDYFLYWDLGVEGYRTFKASRLIDYLTLNIER